MKPSVYIASNTDLAQAHIQTIQRWTARLHFTSTWPFIIGQLLESHPSQMEMSWRKNLSEVSNSDYLIVVQPFDRPPLRGALVEAGMALARGIPVLLVGDEGTESFGSWQYHPGVLGRFPDIDDALNHIHTQVSWEHP